MLYSRNLLDFVNQYHPKIDGWVGGWMDVWMDGSDRQTDRQIKVQIFELHLKDFEVCQTSRDVGMFINTQAVLIEKQPSCTLFPLFLPLLLK